MSTTSLNSSSTLMKRLAYSLASLLTAGVILLLPQTQHALPLRARPAYAAARLLQPAARLLPGARDFWHTDGNRILDSHNHSIRISGMNWSGFETRQAVPGGLDNQDYRAILRTIKQGGYNTVRIPFSNEMIETPTVPEHVGFSNSDGPINADLRDLNSLEILDKIVAYSGKIGLKIILDDHRSEGGSSAEENGLWYTPEFPESSWIGDWTALARRYQNTSTVIGMDLRNEPHNANKGGACWDCGGVNDWHRAAQRAGNAILAVNSRLLIFVEGVDTYAGDTYWWGGNLEGVRRSPVHLAVSNRLVYSAHEYGPTEYAQPWFDGSTSPATLAHIWRQHWAYISEAGIAPVWIGEFGTPNSDADVQSAIPGSEGQWFSSLVRFLKSQPAISWTYWGINGEDRYGLLDISYSSQPANQLKADTLAEIRNGDATRVPLQAATTPRMPTTPARPLEGYATMPSTFAPPTVVAVRQAPEVHVSQALYASGLGAAVSQAPAIHKASHLVDHPRAQRSNVTAGQSLQQTIAASVQAATTNASVSLSSGLRTSGR